MAIVSQECLNLTVGPAPPQGRDLRQSHDSPPDMYRGPAKPKPGHGQMAFFRADALRKTIRR